MQSALSSQVFWESPVSHGHKWLRTSFCIQKGSRLFRLENRDKHEDCFSIRLFFFPTLHKFKHAHNTGQLHLNIPATVKPIFCSSTHLSSHNHYPKGCQQLEEFLKVVLSHPAHHLTAFQNDFWTLEFFNLTSYCQSLTSDWLSLSTGLCRGSVVIINLKVILPS